MPYITRSTVLSVVLCLVLSATQAPAQLVGTLEGPSTVGAQVSNVQGWVYTKTEGAELISPFQVRIDGVDALLVPCCAPRGDVKSVHPDAPLLTGFSGLYNWALLGGGGDEVLVEVIVKDTAGGELVLSKTVPVYALSAKTRFFHNMFAAGPGLGSAPRLEGFCTLSNEDPPTTGPAEIRCQNLLATRANPDSSITLAACDQVTFGWDRGTQGFLQTSDCEQLDRWVDHLDGTATDNWTGLVWEVKADDGSVHDVGNTYSFSSSESSEIRDGTAFTTFLDALNSGSSDGASQATGCFADHCDWRMPTLEELTTIQKASIFCLTLPCIEIPGETAPSTYWSSTAADADTAWTVHFDDGAVTALGKFGGHRVRAVRRP